VMERVEEDVQLTVKVVSRDSKQQLILYFHPGSVAKKFSEFHVSYVSQKDTLDVNTQDLIFQTESGIQLGLTIDELLKIKGEPDSLITSGETSVFQYFIDEFQASDFLQSYNMPVYYARYSFEKGILTEFKFGFEYP
ncbi:MAG: hypothetical protein AAGI38_18685, partial [Bacteroidota bacterium]